MADIVTGTVTGMVDTSALVRDIADVRRETALEAGDVRKDIQAESHRVSEEASRDASNFYIANTAAATQNAKESARSQAWTEAKVDANFQATTGQINLSTAIATGVTALEAAKLNGAMALQHAVMSLQIANEATATRALLNANLIDELREKAEERYTKIVELEGDRRHCERSAQLSQWATLQNQLQMMNSDLQSTKQSVTNFGTGTATGGAQTSNIAH
jgi:hypothetical protein